MRLNGMNRFLLPGAALLLSLPAMSQTVVPPGPVTAFKDMSMAKPPAGAKVAIYEFEDLECPACARAFPMVHSAVDHYKIPLVRHDFPLQGHVWSFDAAVNARYLQDKVSPRTAEEYRGAVFQAQTGIATKEDLANFTRNFFRAHGVALPFVVDPQGVLANEVKGDYNLGVKIGLIETPSIFVVTARNWVQVKDPTQLYAVIEAAEAQTAGPVARSNIRRPVSRQQ